MKAGMCPWATAAPSNAALAEAQIAIRTLNYSSSEVRAPGHIRNKTVTAAMQTPAIENHAGAVSYTHLKPARAVTKIRNGNRDVRIDKATWLAIAQPSSCENRVKAS